MKAYPTNKKKLTKPITAYPEGTRFRTANGMVVIKDKNGDYDTLDNRGMLIISYPKGLRLTPGKQRAGRWYDDGRKKYASDWPPGSEIVEVL